ncbi:hypothetical protein C8J57DRAFT_1464136 [Mycena rebaudengoi]|nr:hypothetical protein C8J57DRAFT_1464136 [Mycena rebaudengoi]
MRLPPTLGSLFLTLASTRFSLAATCPALVGALATIVSGETAWTVSSAVAGAPLLGGQATNPVNTTAKWLLQGVGPSRNPTGFVFTPLNDFTLQVGTSDLLPQSGLHLEPISEAVQQVWSITCVVCPPPPSSGLPEGAHLGSGCTISPILAPQECTAITSGATITIEDCAGAAEQTFDFIGTVAFEG